MLIAAAWLRIRGHAGSEKAILRELTQDQPVDSLRERGW